MTSSLFSPRPCPCLTWGTFTTDCPVSSSPLSVFVVCSVPLTARPQQLCFVHGWLCLVSREVVSNVSVTMRNKTDSTRMFSNGLLLVFLMTPGDILLRCQLWRKRLKAYTKLLTLKAVNLIVCLDVQSFPECSVRCVIMPDSQARGHWLAASW